MNILLIDDHVSFCEGLIAALAGVRSDYNLDFESDAELIPQALLQPNPYDLYILDLMMPGMGGLELVRYLNQHENETPLMVMSSVQDSAVIRQLFQLGVIGYLPKAYGVHQIIDAIEECRQGDLHVPASLLPDLALDDEPPSIVADDEYRGPGVTTLTRRQIEILSLMDRGFSNQEIADALYVSKDTVKTHISRLFRLFDVNNRVNCLRAAKQGTFSLKS